VIQVQSLSKLSERSSSERSELEIHIIYFILFHSLLYVFEGGRGPGGLVWEGGFGAHEKKGVLIIK
jgi:hypothetical protein